jgi:tripartite ATP-independent transporter DctM subunit
MLLATFVSFALLILLLGAGQRIAFALGLMALVVGYIFVGPFFLQVIAIRGFDALKSFELSAVPLFVFMGALINYTGIGGRLYKGISPWLLRLPGGLLHANIVSCTVFAAASGSSVATAATIGTIAIPELEGRNYDRRMLLGSLAAGGTLGILIPPSIIMIIYGAFVGESIPRLFIAGIIPGLMLALLFMSYIAIRSLLQPSIAPAGAAEQIPLSQKAKGLLGITPFLSLIVVILGGIYFGVMTPTEASGVGAFASLILAALYGRLNFGVVKDSLLYALRTTSMVLFIFTAAWIFSATLSYVGVIRQLSEGLSGLPLPPLGILAVIILMYLILGMFLDPASMIVLTLSITYPVVTGLGFDGIWFGIVVTLLAETGLITPPIGMNLFIIQGLRGGYPFHDVAMGSLPFVALLIIGILLLVAFPQIALWLPGKMG